jgi:hypothetical protein
MKPAEVRRFSSLINADEVFGTHSCLVGRVPVNLVVAVALQHTAAGGLYPPKVRSCPVAGLRPPAANASAASISLRLGQRRKFLVGAANSS